ncbi:hypothetical protein ACH5RR_019630 [Cinchona calisaya]|uniref:DUF4378 domain-containing protein n=1 Tax=Cinchona calisaya TaxID=153742 RepID=A0ABD2ZPW7_9GENT
MGKEWLFWGGKSTKKGRSGGRGGGDKLQASAAPTGCMCAVLQIFDLHHFPFALHNHHQPSFKPSGPFLQDEPTVRKGLEAPRNSLELEEPLKEAPAAGSLSSTIKQEENLNISVNIQIKTSCENKSPRASTSKARTDDYISSEYSPGGGAAGTKTPTLVARLMGIDQLPESTGSPSLHSSTLNSLTNTHMHPQGQSQRREQNSQLIISRQYHHHHHGRSCGSNQYYHRSILDNDITMGGSGTLSLPETPRISSARRSDVEHRLSLQINKENLSGDQEFEFSAYTAKKLARRISESRREDDNCRRGSDYARQIVKQVKESVSGRKVGRDITNMRDDNDNVVLLKPNKPSTNNKVVSARLLLGDESCQSKQSTTPSCSPRLLEYPKNKHVTKTQTCQYSQEQIQLKPKPLPVVPTVQQEQPNQQQNSAVKKCKKDGSEKYNSRSLKKPPQVSDAIKNRKEEPFIRSSTTNNKVNVTDKKCKKTPLSNELLNISAVPTLLQVKKDIPFPATKLSDKQASDSQTWKRSTQTLSSCLSQSYKQQQQKKEVTQKSTFQENIQEDRCCSNSTSTSTSPGDKASSEEEYQYYIERILKRTGIDKSTPIALAKWYSSSHPLDPSIFHYIELFHPTTIITTPFSTSLNKDSKLMLRCNRRLVFQLVDELLAEILRNPCCPSRGSDLIDKLCTRIKKFPEANCQVLEDIDALVDTELRCKSKSFQLGEEEDEKEQGERIVWEIERQILESLLHETAMEVAYG